MRQSSMGALLTAIAVLVSCGNLSCSRPQSSNGAESPSSDDQELDPEIKRYTAAELPAVGQPLIPLDQGRVQFAPPDNWSVLPRDSRYLARFVKGEGPNSLPRITITAMGAPEETRDVTEENAALFAAQMQAKSEAQMGRRILESCRPVTLGTRIWSRHVRYVELNRQSCVLQSLETARDGRLYAIELIVQSDGKTNEDFAKAILAHRNEAYAVAANWKFLKELSEPAETAVAETGKQTDSTSEEENPQPDN